MAERADKFFISLNDGTKMPRLGLGTWKAPAEKTKAAVKTAVKAGYRMIDCANDYDNEHVIGEALQVRILTNQRTRMISLTNDKTAFFTCLGAVQGGSCQAGGTVYPGNTCSQSEARYPYN